MRPVAPALPSAEEAERLALELSAIEDPWKKLFALRFEGLVQPYEGQPYLFSAAFPSLSRRDLDWIALAERLLLSYILTLDDLIDGAYDRMKAVAGTLRAQAMRFEADHLLYQMFPPQAAFWRHFRGYLVDHSRACLEERRFAEGLRPWAELTEDLALDIIRSKNGVAQTTVAALVELAGDDRLQAPLAASVLHHFTAWQLWDDLCDWKEDLRAGLPSLLLTRMLREQPPAAEREDVIRQLARKLYYEGHAEYVLDLALDFLQKAEREASVVDGLAWCEAIAGLRSKCMALRHDVEHIVRSNRKRAQEQPAFHLALPEPENLSQRLAWKALGFVLQQWRQGFGEARHIMHLPSSAGGSAESTFHFGDVFQRALIADALCDADATFDGRLRPVIEHETRYLLSRCDTSGVGGWRYFQTAPQMAPDADDLGQVMQALLRAGLRAEAERTCEGPLAVLMRDRALGDGSFETWIIPAQNRTREEERQMRFHRPGRGPDNEVVANLLYALVLYDRERFATAIERGCRWLAARQEADGSWLSSWYYGPFYGTYVCLRLLAAACPDSPAIAAAHRFLLATQRSGGGWGTEAESDPLSTALAILGLRAVEGPGTPPSAAVEQALRSCEDALARQPWPPVLLIKPPHGSRTLTATFVLKASCRAFS